MKEEEVLQWLIDQLANDEIEDINENTLDSLIQNNAYVAVFFCKFYKFPNLKCNCMLKKSYCY